MLANEKTIKDDNGVYYFEYNDQPLTGTSSEFQPKHDEITGDWRGLLNPDEFTSYADDVEKAEFVLERQKRRK